MSETDLHLEPNEASDLAPILDADSLAPHGFDAAYVTVLDEAPAEGCVALLLHAAGAEPDAGWTARRVPARISKKDRGKTEDAEVCVVRDGTLYVLGSQFGSKDGPLQPKRSWAARIREADIAAWLGGGDDPPMELARLRFRLHRAVNDALAAAAVELLPVGPRSREAYIDATIAKGAKKDKSWAGRVTSADQPINVEGAAFRADGRLLLGLRYPVTADGRALMVELDDVDALFVEDAEPRCSTVWVLDGIGSPEEPVGIRAMHVDGTDRFHAVVGNLDSAGKGALVLEDHPEGVHARSTHVAFELPAAAAGGDVRVHVVHRFEDAARVEGIALDGGHTHYVLDRDGHILLATLAVR